MTPALKSLSFLFYHSLLFLPLSHPSFTPCQRTCAPCLTRHTCFLSTACFNLRSAGSCRRQRGLRRWKVSVLWGRGGWWRVEIEKKREKEWLSLRGSRQAIEGTVGALNPFKYNQYRWEEMPSILSVIWMIFTVHSRTTRKPRADACVRTLATHGHPLTARNIHQLPVSPCIFLLKIRAVAKGTRDWSENIYRVRQKELIIIFWNVHFKEKYFTFFNM